jgi:hypothetical protein
MWKGGHAATGYFYLLQRGLPATESVDVIPLGIWVRASVPAFALSMAVGWWLAGRLNGHGQRSSMVVIMVGLVLCAVLNLQLPFAAQFLSTLALTTGFLAGGRLAVVNQRTAGGRTLKLLGRQELTLPTSQTNDMSSVAHHSVA